MADKYHEADVGSHDMAYRVIADHIRTYTQFTKIDKIENNEMTWYV